MTRWYWPVQRPTSTRRPIVQPNEPLNPSILVNAFGAHATGIVRVHNCVVEQLSKIGDVSVANAPRAQGEVAGVVTLTTQDDSRLKSILRDLQQSLMTRPSFDLRVDSAPGFRFGTRSNKQVVIVHDLNFRDRSVHQISTAQFVYRTLLHHWTLRRSDQIVAVSEQTAMEVRSFLRTADQRITVLPLPVDHVPAPQRQTRVLPSETTLRLMTFGHARNKGVLPLLHVLAKNPGWTLDVVCSHVDWERWWFASAAILGVEDRVQIKSGLNDAELFALYEAVDVFCMLSDYEGYGIPVAEALRLGRPTVISNIETLAATGRGFAEPADPTDIDAVALAIRTAVYQDPARLALAVRTFDEWTWEKWAKTLVGLAR